MDPKALIKVLSDLRLILLSRLPDFFDREPWSFHQELSCAHPATLLYKVDLPKKIIYHIGFIVRAFDDEKYPDFLMVNETTYVLAGGIWQVNGEPQERCRMIGGPHTGNPFEYTLSKSNTQRFVDILPHLHGVKTLSVLYPREELDLRGVAIPDSIKYLYGGMAPSSFEYLAAQPNIETVYYCPGHFLSFEWLSANSEKYVCVFRDVEYGFHGRTFPSPRVLILHDAYGIKRFDLPSPDKMLGVTQLWIPTYTHNRMTPQLKSEYESAGIVVEAVDKLPFPIKP